MCSTSLTLLSFASGFNVCTEHLFGEYHSSSVTLGRQNSACCITKWAWGHYDANGSRQLPVICTLGTNIEVRNVSYPCIQIIVLEYHSAGKPFWRIALLISSTGLTEFSMLHNQNLAWHSSSTIIKSFFTPTLSCQQLLQVHQLAKSQNSMATVYSWSPKFLFTCHHFLHDAKSATFQFTNTHQNW